MNTKKSNVHLIFTVVYFIAMILTLVPWVGASKASMLGYKALCSFTPISTLILLVFCALHILLHKGVFGKKK